jgi:hypothetical protein
MSSNVGSPETRGKAVNHTSRASTVGTADAILLKLLWFHNCTYGTMWAVPYERIQVLVLLVTCDVLGTSRASYLFVSVL